MLARKPRWAASLALLSLCSLAWLAACGDGQGSGVAGSSAGAGSGSGGSSNLNATAGGGSLTLSEGGQPEPEASGGTSDCSADFAAASLRPVHLAFALDVSGSMGKLDEPYHDPKLKWQPVVAAARAFFGDASSAGISASLTFFPADDDKCDAAVYETPDVPQTELPSDSFDAAITAIDPQTADDWRGGTPTLAVVQGSVAYLTALAANEPEVLRALVLVTDGYPNGCDDDEIASVSDAISAASAQFATYVIGVENPAGGPDTVSDLQSLAQAGSSEPAIFIDTGDPAQTASALSAAIARIRERAVSCDAPIPNAPGGSPFDPSKVNVSMELGGATSQLGYDPSCESEAAWRYDDVDAPTAIVLCPGTCGAVQADTTAELSVEFGCETRPVVK